MTTASSSRSSLFVLCIGWWTLLLACSSSSVLTNAFVVVPTASRFFVAPQAFRVTATKPLATAAQEASATSSDTADQHDDNELVARRIVVTGDVQGGYYRSCVLNEAGRFRRLVGTMSPPDDTEEAEIYVEGKEKMVDGFIRWCKKSNVGLNQVIKVKEVIEEEPTGLYEEFYVQTK